MCEDENPNVDKGSWNDSFDDMDADDWEEHFGRAEDPGDEEERKT